jgi:hypothetical protein
MLFMFQILADAGPGPLLAPIGGAVAIAGLFLSCAIVSAGFWIIRSARNQEAVGAKRTFWISLGSVCICIAVPLGLLGLFLVILLPLALLLLVVGIVLIVHGIIIPRRPVPSIDDTAVK